MSRLIFWVLVIAAILIAIRLYGLNKAKKRREPTERKATAAMVRCERCGVYLPQEEAKSIPGGFVCVEGPCAIRHQSSDD